MCIDMLDNKQPDTSLMRGLAGEIILLLDELLLMDNPKVRHKIESSIEKLLGSAGNRYDYTFGYGISGIMFLISLLRQYSCISYDTGDIFKNIDQHIINNIDLLNGNYDLLQGSVGVGLAYLARTKSDKSAKLPFESILTTIEKSFVRVGGNTIIPYKAEVHELFQDELWINTGLLHGMTSVIAFYIICIKEGYCDGQMISHIQDYINLLETIQQTGRINIFPNALKFNNSNECTLDCSHPGFYYCQGDLGIANTIVMAAEVLDNTNYYNLAEKAVLNFYNYIVKINLRNYGPFFCHGLAGVYYFLQKYQTIFPYSPIKEVVAECKGLLFNSSGRISGIGILNGTTGIAMSLKCDKCNSFIERVLLLS